MIKIKRRGLFGLLAAPAIISITGKLQPALILPEKKTLVTSGNGIISVTVGEYGRYEVGDIITVSEGPNVRAFFEVRTVTDNGIVADKRILSRHYRDQYQALDTYYD